MAKHSCPSFCSLPSYHLFHHYNSTPSNNHFPRPYKSHSKAPPSFHSKLLPPLPSSHSKAKKVKNMTPMASFLLFFCTLTILSIARAQDRAPHGLVNENPMALSPSAVEFFHPKTKEPDTKKPCATSNCSPFPRAAQLEATQAYESKVSTPQKGKSGIGAGGIAGIVFGLAFVVLVAMGVFYVVITRRDSASQANSVQPDA